MSPEEVMHVLDAAKDWAVRFSGTRVHSGLYCAQRTVEEAIEKDYPDYIHSVRYATMVHDYDRMFGSLNGKRVDPAMAQRLLDCLAEKLR